MTKQNGEECAGNDADLVEELPEIGANDTFRFDCGPELPCFNRCCRELALPLTPYDILRLRRQLGISGDRFLHTFTTLRSFPDTGFPLPMLRMIESPEAPCPFVTPAGCSVYEDRPGACRSYPLGRGAKLTTNGVAERFFVIHEEYCKGFDNGASRAPARWFAAQGLEPYNKYNDRYMLLISMTRATKAPIDSRMANMCLLCLYQLDHFRMLIDKMKIFSRVEISSARRAEIMADSLQADEACLDFAFDWLELVIFGTAANLRKKGA